MFKYELGQVVYYMINNRVYSGIIKARLYIESLIEFPYILYDTTHESFKESEIFESRQALLDHLNKIERKGKKNANKRK